MTKYDNILMRLNTGEKVPEEAIVDAIESAITKIPDGEELSRFRTRIGTNTPIPIEDRLNILRDSFGRNLGVDMDAANQILLRICKEYPSDPDRAEYLHQAFQWRKANVSFS